MNKASIKKVNHLLNIYCLIKEKLVIIDVMDFIKILLGLLFFFVFNDSYWKVSSFFLIDARTERWSWIIEDNMLKGLDPFILILWNIKFEGLSRKIWIFTAFLISISKSKRKKTDNRTKIKHKTLKYFGLILKLR